MTEQIQQLPLECVVPSPTNPRKVFNEAEIAGLADSIKHNGLLQPITVRPWPNALGDKKNGAGEHLPLPTSHRFGKVTVAYKDASKCYEIVAGERRYRACLSLNLGKIPAIVREYDSGQVRELQLIENLQRADLDELEEAAGYQSLLKDNGYTIDQLVEKIGKKRSFIYGRLKLLELPPDLQQQLRERKFHASIALLLARIPDKKSQQECAQWVAKGKEDYIGLGENGEPENQPYPEREVDAHIREKYMIRLKGAAFNIKDPLLFMDHADKATWAKLGFQPGPCTTCPFRTGNMLELYPELAKSPDVCTNPACFRAKCDANFKKESTRIAEQKGEDITILDPKESKKLFGHNYGHGEQERWHLRGNYISLDDACEYHPKRQNWRAVLRKQDVTPILARDPAGHIHELLSRPTALAAAKKAGLKLPKSATASNRPQMSWEEENRIREERGKVFRSVYLSIIDDLIQGIDKKTSEKALLEYFIEREFHHVNPTFLERRALHKEKLAMDKLRADLKKSPLKAILLCYYEKSELLQPYHSYSNEIDKSFVTLCSQHRIDIKKLFKEALKKAQAEAKAGKKNAKDAADSEPEEDEDEE